MTLKSLHGNPAVIILALFTNSRPPVTRLVQTDDVDSAVLRADSGSQGSQGNQRGQESRSTQGSRKDPRRAGKAKFAKGAIEAKDAYEIPGLAWDIN